MGISRRKRGNKLKNRFKKKKIRKWVEVEEYKEYLTLNEFDKELINFLLQFNSKSTEKFILNPSYYLKKYLGSYDLPKELFYNVLNWFHDTSFYKTGLDNIFMKYDAPLEYFIKYLSALEEYNIEVFKKYPSFLLHAINKTEEVNFKYYEKNEYISNELMNEIKNILNKPFSFFNKMNVLNLANFFLFGQLPDSISEKILNIILNHAPHFNYELFLYYYSTYHGPSKKIYKKILHYFKYNLININANLNIIVPIEYLPLHLYLTSGRTDFLFTPEIISDFPNLLTSADEGLRALYIKSLKENK